MSATIARRTPRTHGTVRTLAIPLLLPVLAALIAVAATAVPARADLASEVDQAVRLSGLGSATVAISVRDPDTDLELVEHNDREPMILASNLKLITTGAALHVLGADFRFRTYMKWNGSTLTIIGDGDPAFGDPDLLEVMQVGSKVGLSTVEFIDIWTDAVADAGIKQIHELVVDDRIFDREFVHPAWPADQLNRRYCAEVSGFNFHQNVLHLFLQPRSGSRPVVRGLSPNYSWLNFTNKATSNVGKESQQTVWLHRPRTSNEMTIFGNVKHANTVPVPVTMHDVPDLFARLLAQRLTAKGVRVGAARAAHSDDPQPQGEVVGPVVSTPLSTVVTRCNRDSENLFAESLVKRIGHAMTGQPGSWENGRAITRMVVKERLNDPAAAASLMLSDGSGLSRDNKMTAETMTAWLASFHRDPKLGDVFINSLALGGVNGTLEKRFVSSGLGSAQVQAKSGYINGVSTLSGFITMPDGRRRAFSVLVNDIHGPVGKAKALQEKIVSIIVENLTAASPLQLGSD